MNQLIISAATEGEVNPLVPNVWEMGVVLVGFAILMFIVVKFVVPMFEKTFAERAEAIEGGIAKAEKAQAEASAALEEYKQQLTDARTEALRISRRRRPPNRPASPPRHMRRSNPSARRPLCRCVQRLARWPPPWPDASSVKRSTMTSVQPASWTASWQTWNPRTQVQRSNGRRIERIAGNSAGGTGSKTSDGVAAVGKGTLRNSGNGGQLGWLAPRPD